MLSRSLAAMPMGPPGLERSSSARAVPPPDRAGTEAAAPADSRYGATLATWLASVVALQAVLWLSGLRDLGLSEAIRAGAARAESRAVGEVTADLASKAIRSQYESQSFWNTLALFDDFAIEPMALVARALVVATLLSALAALMGRPARFDRAFAACVAIQGVWVLGLAVRVGLAIALRRNEVETSAVLLLPAGTYRATTWLALRQVDAFALWGWLAMALGGWGRGQANLVVSAATCLLVAAAEVACRCSVALVLGAGMRLSFLPD